MDQDDKKNLVAEAALEYIKNGDILGIGSGSTVNKFINLLGSVRNKIEACVSSSNTSTELLKNMNIEVIDLKDAKSIPLYIDGADEANSQKELIKGGGGAHTKEKVLASSSKCFICIADSTKRVEQLGAFPLPIEVIPFAKDSVLHALGEYSENIIQRDFITDSGNIILDLHGVDLRSPKEIETKLNLIPGVIDNGIFAHHVPRYIVVGNSEGYELIES